MTMALAVAMVACQAAAPGKAGEPGEPGAPGEPGKTPELVAPVIKAPFEPVMLMVEGDAAQPIDVSAHFYDPEGETLTYAIAVDPAEGVVTAELAEGMLTITPGAEGSATITVTATDPDSKSTSASIKVTVAPEGMMPPVTVGTIDAVSLDVGAIKTIQDISQYFSEPEEEMLTYEVGFAPALIVAVNLDGTTNNLTIRGDAYGEATVTVTATDEDDLSVSQKISVTVEVPVTLPPEPDPVAPEKSAIPDQMLYQADGAQTIDLSMNFTHENAITYAVNSSPAGIVRAEESSGTLTLTPLVTGQTIVTVTATADEQNIMDDFIVTVMAGSKPTVTPPDPDPPAAKGMIMDQEVEVGKATAAMDVSAYFTPATGLTYTASSSPATTATVAVVGSSLKITGVKIGTATVTVTATDSKNLMANQNIVVTVTAMNAVLKPDAVTIPGVTKSENITIG